MNSFLQHFNNEIFANKTSKLTLIRSARHKEANYYLNELSNEYSKTLSDKKIEMKNVNGNYKKNFAFFNVLFIDSYESFRKIDPGPLSTTQDFSEYYSIVYYALNKEHEKEIQQIFDYFWQYYIINVALLVETPKENDIVLYTYYPFTQKSCKNAQINIISRNKSILQLKAAEIFPHKLKNFYNCTIMAALWNVPPYLELPAPGSTSKQIRGMEGYVLNVLAKVLKFKIDYVVPPNNEQRGYAKPNKTFTGAIKMLSERAADLSLGSFRCTLDRSTALSPSITFYQTMQVFTVLNLHHPWSSLEIIAFPFDLHIWIVLMVLVIFLLASPYILQFYRPHILRFIYGFSSVYLININIIAITLNQTILFMPRRNFARYVFLMWILLTMNLRSIYQGALYDFLTTQQKMPPPNTVADLIRRGYTLIVNTATNDTFSGVPVIHNKLLKVLIMNTSDVGGFPLLEANPDKNYVTGSPKDFLTYYAKTESKNGVFHVLKETVFSQHLCIYFTKHSYLMNTFNDVLSNLRNFGLINYWASQLLNYRFLEQVNVAAKAPITLTQSSGIVKICLFLYFIAVIVFVCEIVWFKLKSKHSLDDQILRK